VRARGRLGRPDSMHVEVPSFTATSGASQISGSMTIDNLEHPRVTLDGKSRYLDIDDFLPAKIGETTGEKTTEKKATASARERTGRASPKDDSLLARAEGRAKLAVDKGRAAGIDCQDLRADLTVAEGRLRAHALEVAAFGGKFSGAGSELPLAGGAEPFVAKGTIAAMDVATLLARFAPDAKVLGGSLSADIDLSGRGTRPADLKNSLTGKLTGGIANAEFLPAALLDPVARALARAVKVPALASALGQAEQRVAAFADRALGDLAGAVRFDGGVMEIAKPLTARTPHGSLVLAGKVGLDGRTDLTGTLALTPEAVASLVGGKLNLTEPLPVKLKLSGPLRSPHIAVTELEQPARVLATAFVGSAVEGASQQVQKAAEPARQGVKQGVERAKEAAGRRLRRILPR